MQDYLTRLWRGWIYHQFESTLMVEQVDVQLWRLLVPLKYRFGDLLIEVPAGFVSDYASVPKLMQWLFKPWGIYHRAAVVHDWLYEPKIGKSYDVDRLTADIIFFTAMYVDQTPIYVKTLFFMAVRLTGWIWWYS